MIDYFDQTIDTYIGLAPEMEWVNIWHEILHGILNNAGFEDHDEQLINTLAAGICQVLSDNEFVHRPIDPILRCEPEDKKPDTLITEEFQNVDIGTNSNTLA